MNIEESIKNVITDKMSDGTVERLISESIEKAIASTLNDLFNWNSPARKKLETKLNEVLVPALERYDYSRYVVKLDKVLDDILENTNISEAKTMLEKFRSLMIEPKCKEIKLSEIVKEWHKHVAENVDTEELEIDYDDGVSYETVECTMSITEEKKPTWYTSNYDKRTVVLECEHDDNMNFIIPLSRYKNDTSEGYEINIKSEYDISSLRYLSDFEIFLMKLERANVKVILDIDEDEDYITPDKEPELSYT